MAGDTAIDFARSSITWLLPEQPSHGRFAIDASLALPGGETFYLCAQVFAGNVYGDGPLFKDPPYGFSAAFSESRYRIFRDSERGHAIEDSAGSVSDRFLRVEADIVGCACAPILPDVLTDGARRLLSARVRLGHTELEFPLRHVNWRNDGRYQAETGPVLLVEGEPSDTLGALRRAYVIFNRLDRIEFLVDAPRAGLASRRWDHNFSAECQIQLLEMQL
jgi:hypothetical protein